MAIDTENKRRAAPNFYLYNTLPVPDGVIGVSDRKNITGIYPLFSLVPGDARQHFIVLARGREYEVVVREMDFATTGRISEYTLSERVKLFNLINRQIPYLAQGRIDDYVLVTREKDKTVTDRQDVFLVEERDKQYQAVSKLNELVIVEKPKELIIEGRVQNYVISGRRSSFKIT